MKYLKLILPLLFPAALTQAQQITNAAYLDRFDGLFADVKINNRKVLLHRSGLVTIDKIENQGYFHTVVGIKDNAYGAINYNGKIIAPFTFDEVRLADEDDEYDPSNNYCYVITKLNGKYGAIDTLGNVICKNEYQLIEPLNARLLKIQRNGRWGWVELTTGKVLQEPAYTDVGKSYVSPYVEITNNGKKGLAKESGEVVAAPEYTSFHYPGIENSRQFGYEINGKIGLIDLSGKKITPAVYTRVQRGPVAGTFAVTQNGKTGIIDSTGKVLAALVYTEVSPFGSFLVVKQEQKFGVLDKSGAMVLPVQFDNLEVYSSNGQPQMSSTTLQKRWVSPEPAYFLAKKGALKELYDSTGKKHLSGNYPFITLYASQKGTFVVTKNAKGDQALLRTDGSAIIPTGFEELLDGYHSTYLYMDRAAGNQKKDYVAIAANGKMGLYHLPTSKMILPLKYTRIEWQNEQLLNVREGEDAYSMININGKVVKPLQRYGYYTAVAPDRIIETKYRDNGKLTTLTDESGAVLYSKEDWDFKENSFSRLLMKPGEEPEHIMYAEGLLKMWNVPEENLFLNMKGEEVRFKEYDFVSDFYNGLAIAGKMDANRNATYGIINRKGDIIYPITASDIKQFDSSLVLVKTDTLQGLLRKDGTVFIPMKYKQISSIYGIPYFKVSTSEGEGVLDSTGKEVIAPAFRELYYDKDHKLFQATTHDDKYGLIGLDGKVMLPAVYDELNRNNGYSADGFPVLVKKDNKYFYVDGEGKELPYASAKSKGYND
ncbi:WG containing repeat-containing protein [Chitinophaga jiangningensis]|uniref:WG containing repeat-containing protein n=1 Tax=Chitinophaga jiangningensis TaxID=1419482 RepID=A0A1M7C5U2_9BACT|nr:WG repeat-containing protein [Chitinophaga jiangningensis]SHL62585.1 WG containing repeat-containing protein [Chitinophaga jiangningensis]